VIAVLGASAVALFFGALVGFIAASILSARKLSAVKEDLTQCHYTLLRERRCADSRDLVGSPRRARGETLDPEDILPSIY